MRTLLRDPLVHFALIGAVVFALYAALAPQAGPAPVAATTAAPDRTIVIDAQITDGLTRAFEGVWRRLPTAAELDGLIEAHIAEEVLVREAQALQLDRGDAVVRERLRLKMEFLLEGAAAGETADEATLRSWHADNAERFSDPATISFRQIFAGRDRAAAQALGAKLASGAEDVEGVATLLPGEVASARLAAVDARFGVGFAEQVAALPLETWAGPIRSGYGFHLVRLEAREPPQLRPFADVAETVRADWQAAMAAEARRSGLAALRDRYEVVRADAAEAPE